jgi:hypothetical protein
MKNRLFFLLAILILLFTFSCGGGGTNSGGSGSGSGDGTNGSSPSALCNDGTYSYSANCSGTCSHHGGVREWYNNCGKFVWILETEQVRDN